MRIAHLSDLHLLALDGVPLRRFINKRFTGWLNLRMKRGSIHKGTYVSAIARAIAKANVDHVVITGDLTNLALEGEFELARQVIQRDLGFDPANVTVVPGNHDLYTRGALRSRRFERYFGDWLESDLPDFAVDIGVGRFPVVKLRGDVAIIALSSAVPRPPLVAAGEIGARQLGALARILEHRDVAGRTLVVALHHPIVQDWSKTKTHFEGLRDANALLSLLRFAPCGLILHGHLHRRIQRHLSTPAGKLFQVGATSASLHDEAPAKMAGYNAYDVDAKGVSRIEAFVHDPDKGGFYRDSVPRHV